MKDHVRLYGKRRWRTFRQPMRIDVEGDAMASIDLVQALANDNPEARVVLYTAYHAYRYAGDPETGMAKEIGSRDRNPALLGGGVDRPTE